MGKFVIQAHGRLQEWVAEENGYFRDERLDYEFSPRRMARGPRAADSPPDLLDGAFEMFEDGAGCSVGTACHWTVNMAASAGHGKIWGDAYTVTPGGIFVLPDSRIHTPEDLAGVKVAVGYHSGSHYSTIQRLDQLMAPDQIKLKFVGALLDRLELLIDEKIEAAHLFGAPYYVMEQLGFRKIIDATFVSAALISPGASPDDAGKYFRALRRAQRDIDLRPEFCTRFFLKELPEKYHAMVDVRRFGPGERIVFEPYSREIFEKTRNWVDEHALFDEKQAGKGGYQDSVLTGRQ